jgi:hypothetical protein
MGCCVGRSTFGLFWFFLCPHFPQDRPTRKTRMGHSDFIKLRLESLSKKSVDQYTNELLDADVDIIQLLSNPSVDLFKEFYNQILTGKLDKCLHSGATYEDISKIFSRSSTLKEILHQLDQLTDSASLKNSRNFDVTNQEKSQEKNVFPGHQQFEHEEMKAVNKDDQRKIPADQNPIEEVHSVQNPLIKEDYDSIRQREISTPEKRNLAPFSSALGIDDREQLQVPPAEEKQTFKENIPKSIYQEAFPAADLGWICEHCTYRNNNTNGSCDTCGEFKAARKCNLPNGLDYSILSSPQSQYTLGAVSACTNMSFQALYECLKHIEGNSIPFGCTVSLLHQILATASEYTSKSHQDLEDVISSRPDITNNLFRVSLFLSRYLLFDASPLRSSLE